MLTLGDVWQALIGPDAAPLRLHAGSEGTGIDHAIERVVIDSRTAEANSLFVALRGERTDGHLHLEDAFQKGAIAAIAEAHAMQSGAVATFVLPGGAIEGSGSRLVFIVPDSIVGLQRLAAFWRQKMPAEAVSITGSVGKTTTKEIVANVLAQRYTTLRSEGNLNNEIGLPLTLLQLTEEHERIVLEMGMYNTGEISRLCELARPRIGVVTNVGMSHLERLGTVERIAQAKGELPRALPAADQGGVAVLNADDPLVLAMAGVTKARVFTYGLSSESHLWADDIISEGLEGIRFRFHYQDEAFHVKLPMLGRHSVHTALRSAAVGLVDGLSWTEIIAGLNELRGQLRLIVVPSMRGATLIDDTYNASPDSMLAALNLLEEVANASHRAIAVLGEMFELGPFAEMGHRRVGGRAAQIAAKLIAVGRQARWYAEEALACGMTTADVHPVESTADAVAVLQGLVRPGDVVLIKGSRAAGMETIVDALARPFPGSGAIARAQEGRIP